MITLQELREYLAMYEDLLGSAPRQYQDELRTSIRTVKRLIKYAEAKQKQLRYNPEGDE
jgi:hypothetical protein